MRQARLRDHARRLPAGVPLPVAVLVVAVAAALATAAGAVEPVALEYCGYIGGSYRASSVDTDTAGVLYVTGATNADAPPFPATVGPDLTHSVGEDAFVARVRADGRGFEYAGYIGGTGTDIGEHVAVDAAGRAYVTGYTGSDAATFPVLIGPGLTLAGKNDAFVARVAADGSRLEYAGYIGGDDYDSGWGIAVDGAGRAVVAGSARSLETTFPTAIGPDLTFNGGSTDAYVARVEADGTGLVYSGYLGGAGEDYAFGVALDASGSAVVAGSTGSTETSFPIAIGPDSTYNGGTEDAFVARVRSDGTSLAQAGYVGGDVDELAWGVALDATGSAYLTGNTRSSELFFPALVGPDLTYNGGATYLGDAFVVKVRREGDRLVHAGYIGGNAGERGLDIAVDAAGLARVVGVTFSTETSFPVILGPDLTFNGQSGDVFVARLSAGGDCLAYAGYIGGDGTPRTEQGNGIALDGAGNAHVGGETASSELTFPVTVGPGLKFDGGAFVAKLVETPCADAVPPIVLLRAVKPLFAIDDVAMTWQAEPAASGYNLWYVTAKERIPLAALKTAPPAIGVAGCSPPASAPGPACTDAGAVPRGSPAVFFYQAHGACGCGNEGA